MTRYKITSKKSGKSRRNLTLKEVLALTKMSSLAFAAALAEGHDHLVIEEEMKPKSPSSKNGAPFWRRKPVTTIFATAGVAILASHLFQATRNAAPSNEEPNERSANHSEAISANEREAAEQGATDCWGEADAFAAVAAQQEMKKHLKSPGTAKFPWFDNHVSDAGNCQFIVTSYVDSQNGFGGIVRTDFIASVQITGERQATVEILTAAQR